MVDSQDSASGSRKKSVESTLFTDGDDSDDDGSDSMEVES